MEKVVPFPRQVSGKYISEIKLYEFRLQTWGNQTWFAISDLFC